MDYKYYQYSAVYNASNLRQKWLTKPEFERAKAHYQDAEDALNESVEGRNWDHYVALRHLLLIPEWERFLEIKGAIQDYRSKFESIDWAARGYTEVK